MGIAAAFFVFAIIVWVVGTVAALLKRHVGHGSLWGIIQMA